MNDMSEKYRREIMSKCRDEISQNLEPMKAEGKFPFEGKFRTLEEIKGLQELMKKKDRIIFRDLVSLFLIFAVFNILLLVFLLIL